MAELTPYLTVHNARAAMKWYADVLQANVTFEPIVMPDGRIGHTEMEIAGARFMMADAAPEIHAPAPHRGEGSPVTLHLTVDDVDELARAVRAAGTELDRGPEDSPPAGRVAVFRDPFGHRWFLTAPLG